MNERLSDEETARLELRSVAVRRVTYEACAAFLFKEAADLFTKNKDEHAQLVRRLANRVEEWRKEAAADQEAILNRSKRGGK
jgi:hypothetical protein